MSPSERGHEGAGGFSQEGLAFHSTEGTFIVGFIGRRKSALSSWMDSADVSGDGSTLALFGGLGGNDGHPLRFDDIWVLRPAQ